MALLYTISDTELTKATLTKRAKLNPNTNWHQYSTIKKVTLLSLTIVNLILWVFVYEVWPGKEPPIADFTQAGLGFVTGIMYSQDKPSAIIHGKSVYQGDVVDGYKVVEIGRRQVVFEKDGRVVTKQVSVGKTR